VERRRPYLDHKINMFNKTAMLKKADLLSQTANVELMKTLDNLAEKHALAVTPEEKKMIEGTPSLT